MRELEQLRDMRRVSGLTPAEIVVRLEREMHPVSILTVTRWLEGGTVQPHGASILAIRRVLARYDEEIRAENE